MPAGNIANPAAGSNALKGIGFMLLAALMSSVMNSAARQVMDTVHPFEVVFFRNLFAMFFVLPLMWRVGLSVFRTNRLGMHFSRATLNTVNMLVWFTGVSLAPLADVVALSFSAPIFTTLLSIFVLHEVVGLRRWTAIAVGFAGTMLVLQPGFGTITLGHGLALTATVAWAAILLIIKSLSRTESSLTIVAYMSVLMTPIALVPALFVWTWPTWTELAWLVLIGMCGGAAQYSIAQSFREADISLVMPFDFTKLIWITAIAYLAFGEMPSLATWIGGAIIFVSGLYIARREARMARARKDAIPPALP